LFNQVVQNATIAQSHAESVVRALDSNNDTLLHAHELEHLKSFPDNKVSLAGLLPKTEEGLSVMGLMQDAWGLFVIAMCVYFFKGAVEHFANERAKAH